MPFTASDFANWVFEREVGTKYRRRTTENNQDWNPEYIRKYLGYLSHYEIEEMRRYHFKPKWKVDDQTLWEVDYRDTEQDSDVLKSSSLVKITDGRKLRGKPDLVLKNKEIGHILIIERKTTIKSKEELQWGSSDPGNWPNCKAQLWAYAHLDRYFGAPLITLILQPWHRDKHGNHEMGATNERTFKMGDEFDLENLRLFKAYGGMRSGSR